MKKPIYMYQCIVCRQNLITHDTTFFHCGRLTQWVNGIDGKGIDMNSPKVRIRVEGFIEMSEENLKTILGCQLDFIHTSLVYSLHMGYVDSKGLEFDIPDKYLQAEKMVEKTVEKTVQKRR